MRSSWMAVALVSALTSMACSGASSTGSSDGGAGGDGGGGGDGGVSSSGLRPIQCLCYSPEPSDYAANHGATGKYYDSDFANDDFTALWGSYVDTGTGQNIGRQDLKHFAQDLGINMLRVYDWGVPSLRNHVPFLDECHKYGIRTMVPISNYFVGLVQKNDASVKAQIAAIVKEVYQNGVKPHPAVAMFSVSNEWELSGNAITPDGIAKATAMIVQAEDALGVAAADRLPLTSPVSFAVKPPSADPSISAIMGLKSAFQSNGLGAVFDARFMVGVNIYSKGSDIVTYLQTTYPKNFGTRPPSLFFSEIGQNSDASNGGEAGQASWEMGQLAAVLPLARDATQTTNGYFLGACVFQSLDRTDKGGTEAQFGIYKFGTGTPPNAKTRSGQTYPVDNLLPKAAVGVVQSAFKG